MNTARILSIFSFLHVFCMRKKKLARAMLKLIIIGSVLIMIIIVGSAWLFPPFLKPFFFSYNEKSRLATKRIPIDTHTLSIFVKLV